MTDSVLQIRLELLETRPLIWRRIRLDAACTFWDLHVAIQNTMGWTDSHLHMFQLADDDGQERLIGLASDDDELGIEPGWEHRVTDWLSVARSRTVYEYDFGDSWEHGVVLEDVLPADGGRYPRCVAGARACPPEDVGGVHGYAEFLKAIADPAHRQHDDYLAWVGGAFDPERFEAKAVRFEDPKRRWRQVYGNAPPRTGPAPVLPPLPPPRMEGDFALRDQQILNNTPFSDESALQWHTDLPAEALGVAPLWTDMRRFLQVLAADGAWKLTPKGNLQRATLAKLIEAEAVGRDWWRRDRPPRDESDLPRATLLRTLADLAGLTRKQKGRLQPTKRGAAAADGSMPAGELYRRLLETHTTKYNWICADGFAEAHTLQRGWWYLVWLLGRYGQEPRPSSFYATKMAEAFPWLLREVAATSYATVEQCLARMVEVRAIRRWARELGLAATSTDDEWSREPCQVWAGPLLAEVVRWRR